MKLSVSLPEDAVTFLDRYVAGHGMPSRSAAVQRAVDLLRASELGPAYAAAWASWDAEDGVAWDAVVGDGLARS